MVLGVEAVILGLIQGITEWLPISSKSQSIIAAMTLFGVSPESAFSFAIFLHIGTMLAAALFFRAEIRQLLKERKQWPFFVLALIGTGIVGLPLYFFVNSALVSVFWMTLLIGILLIASGALQLFSKPVAAKSEYSIKNGFLLGLGQGFSILPGVSRSGITTSVLLLERFDPSEALRASFLLSIPTVFFAEILIGATNPIVLEWTALLAVFTAFITGYLTLFLYMKLAKRISFAAFAIGFGVLYIGLAFLG